MKLVEKYNIRLIFIYLIFYGLSIGVWSEFSQIWLNNQNITISNIGLIIAAASFLAGIIVILITKYIKKINELLIIKLAFSFKIVFLIGMVLGYHFTIKWLSITCYMIDSIINNLIVLITYPLLSYILKDEKIYSKRKLIEYSATDLGILISSFLIGKSIGSFIIDYNSLLILSIIFTFCASIVVYFIKNTEKFHNNSKGSIRRIFKDKILKIYLVYLFIGQIAYFTALGMQLLLIINYTNLSASNGALFIVICCILGDIFGYIALKKLTPKNDYVTILIKFAIRLTFYILIVILPIKEILLSALFVSLFVSRAYENKTDGIYVNRCPNQDMLTFSNIRYGVGYIGKAIGTLICGLTFDLGLRYIFGIAIIFIFIQIVMALFLIKLRKNEEKISLV